jgi:hypothetical protein
MGASMAMVKEVVMRGITTRGIATVMALTLWACGSGSRVADFVGSTEHDRPPAPSSVAGTWSGGSDSMHLVWSLTQEGENVSGTSQVSGRGWTGRGRVVGTITGSTFTFNDTHPVGTLDVEGCSAEFRGALELRRIQAPVGTPRPYYPGGHPIGPPPPATRSSMSGLVQGTACGNPFTGMITVVKN